MSEKLPLIYGANGYTGELIAREAARRGLRPILAGRNRQPIETLAGELGCPSRVFDLKTPPIEHLSDIAAVLNCAGPFVRTAQPMVEACIAARASYLDITGEISVIEMAAAADSRAKQAGISLLPAVGFDVVPTDCLAAMLARRLPNAEKLELAFSGTGGISRGTALTMLESMPDAGRARINGQIVPVATAWKAKEIPFHDHPRWAMTIPWGDVASAYYSTGIPNIEVYAAVPRKQIARLKRLRAVTHVVKVPGARPLLAKLIRSFVKGPNAEDRDTTRSSFWGCVSRGHEQVAATMETPSGYKLTVLTAVAALERVLAGNVKSGFATPSMAFGPEFILSIPGTQVWEGSR